MKFYWQTLIADLPRNADAGGGAGEGASAAVSTPPAGAPSGEGQQQATQQQPWYAPLNLPDYACAFIEDRNFPDLPTVFKSAIESDRMARSRNVLEKPDPKGDITQWAGWNDLGVPADLAKYELKAPEVKEGRVLDPGIFDAFRKAAHEAKVLPSQASALFGSMWNALNAKADELAAADTAAQAKAAADAKAQSEALMSDLRARWGGDFDKKTELGRRAAAALGIKDGAGELEKIIGAPRLVELFAAIGERLGEASLSGLGDRTSSALGDLTPDQAAAERRRLEGDPEWMRVFNDPRNPLSKDYAARRMKLIEIEASRRA